MYYKINGNENPGLYIFKSFTSEYNRTAEDIRPNQINVNDSVFISVSYRVYGAFGGNCWGDEPRYENGFEDEIVTSDDFVKMLDSVQLVDMEPMSLKEFFRIKDNIKFGEYTENEYYGNYTVYKRLYVECIVKNIDIKKQNIELELK
jgi:hypothetical protein